MTKATHRAEIRALTGLRGVAAILVASYHYTGFGLMAPSLIAPLVRHGYLAVDLFFALSGYVMALTYGHVFQNGAGPYRHFLWRRLQRIYPLYAVCILATFVLVGSGVLQPLSASANSTLRLGSICSCCNALAPGLRCCRFPGRSAPNGSPTWHFRCWHARRCIAAPGRRGRWLACAWRCFGALCEVPDTWLHGLHFRGSLHQSLGHVDTATPYPCCAAWPASAWGCSPGARRVRPMSPRRSARPGAVGGVSLACIAVLWAPWADFVVVPCFAWLLLCLGSSPNPARAGPARWLASAPVHWLGKVSYSLYLTHLLLWQAIHSWLDRLGLPQLLLLVPALLLAVLCYTLIEQPGRRLLAPWGGTNLL